ncbi:MAG: phosphodiester glycosidase family protein [Spirochaetaceae bacterium]|jgi:hypothetical protein|nr:phosphodiester glycosidase family protein [Spirochaetaceae bacterium]
MRTMYRLAAGFLLVLVSACSTLPPGERGDLSIEPVRAASIPAIVPRWQPISARGEVAVFAGKVEAPRLEFWALKIERDSGMEDRLVGDTDIKTPPALEEKPVLRILLGPGAGFLRPGYVLSTRVSSFVRDNGLLAGINTVPFDPSSRREGEERRVVGIAVIEGKEISPPAPRYDALLFYQDGRAAIVNQGELGAEPSSRDILYAVGGFHCLLRDGELTERALQKAAGPRYARSAAGLSNGGKTLYLIAINGGLPGNRGATEAETALILKQLGARDVLNLDGGGSSALALRFPRDTVKILNTPSHGGFPGQERAVALCLGIGFYPAADEEPSSYVNGSQN